MTAMTAEQLRAEFASLNEFLGVVSGYAKIDDERVRLARSKLNSIAARLSGMAADAWQPIETAPKDGFVTELQYKGGQVTRGHWVSQVRMWNCYGVFRDPAEFTAWFRIPEPPHV